MPLGVNFPGDYYGNDVAKSYDMFGYFDNMRQKEEAFKNQDMVRQAAMQDYLFKEQMNPYKLKEAETSQRANEASLESALYKNRDLKRETEVREAVPIETEVKAAIMKATTEMSNNEWTQTQNAIKQMMVDRSDENVRKLGKLLYGLMPDMIKQRELLASREEIARTREEARLAAAKETTQRQLQLVRARGEEARRQLATTKDPKTYQEAAVKFRTMADAVEDDAVRAELLAKASEFERAALTLAQARGAGQIDAGAVTGLPTKEVTPQLGTSGKPGSSKDNPIVLK